MSAVEYGPEDTWPRHQEQYWRESLAIARQAGWSLNYVNAPHRFGEVYCPAREHSFMVDKTARGSETKAKEARKKVVRCNHPAGSIRDQQDESQDLLDTADHLVAEVAEGLAAAEAKRDAWERLDRLEIQLDTAAANVEEILLAEQEAVLEEAVDVDDAPDTSILAGKLSEATAAVAGSESIAKSVRSGHPGVARPLLGRASSLRTRIGELRSRLAALQERSRSDVS